MPTFSKTTLFLALCCASLLPAQTPVIGVGGGGGNTATGVNGANIPLNVTAPNFLGTNSSGQLVTQTQVAPAASALTGYQLPSTITSAPGLPFLGTTVYGDQAITQPQVGNTYFQTFQLSSLNHILHPEGFTQPYVSIFCGRTVAAKYTWDVVACAAGDLVRLTSFSVPVSLGSQYYSKCAPTILATSGPFSVDVFGTGIRGSFINQSTDAGCQTGISQALITKPVSSTGQQSNITWSNVTIEANGVGKGCLSVLGSETSSFTNNHCDGLPPGASYGFQIGDYTVTNGGAEGTVLLNNAVSNPISHAVPEATVVPTFTSGALTGLSCGSLCGNYIDGTIYGTSIAEMTQVVFNDPHHYCDTLPVATVGLTGTEPGAGAAFVNTTLNNSSWTITNAGSCPRGNPSVVVKAVYPVTYGIVADSSDSRSMFNQVYVGSSCAFRWDGGRISSYGDHPTDTICGVESRSQISIENLEADTIIQDYVRLDAGASYSTIVGTTAYDTSHVLPGNAAYNLATGVTHTSFGVSGALSSIAGGQPGFVEFHGPNGAETQGVSSTGWDMTNQVSMDDAYAGNGQDYLAKLATGTLTTGTIQAPEGGALTVASYTNMNGYVNLNGGYNVPAGTGSYNNGDVFYGTSSQLHVGPAGALASKPGATLDSTSGTIALVANFTPVSNTGALATISSSGLNYNSTYGGCVYLLPLGAWTWGTSGNIGNSGTATVNQIVAACYLAGTNKWYLR